MTLFQLIVLSFMLCANAFAVEGLTAVEMAEINVNGKTYSFPVGDTYRKADIYYLKKALKGDKEALEMFLGGGEYRTFYIGAESPLWMVVDKNGSFKVEESIGG